MVAWKHPLDPDTPGFLAKPWTAEVPAKVGADMARLS